MNYTTKTIPIPTMFAAHEPMHTYEVPTKQPRTAVKDVMTAAKATRAAVNALKDPRLSEVRHQLEGVLDDLQGVQMQLKGTMQ